MMGDESSVMLPSLLLLISSSSLQYLQVNSRDKQSEMKSSRSLGDLKGSLLKGSERVRKHSTGELPYGKDALRN